MFFRKTLLFNIKNHIKINFYLGVALVYDSTLLTVRWINSQKWVNDEFVWFRCATAVLMCFCQLPAAIKILEMYFLSWISTHPNLRFYVETRACRAPAGIISTARDGDLSRRSSGSAALFSLWRAHETRYWVSCPRAKLKSPNVPVACGSFHCLTAGRQTTASSAACMETACPSTSCLFCADCTHEAEGFSFVWLKRISVQTRRQSPTPIR